MNSINCPICQNPLSITIARGRKSNKPFIMLKCPIDGRHFRGFISDIQFVSNVLESQESQYNLFKNTDDNIQAISSKQACIQEKYSS